MSEKCRVGRKLHRLDLLMAYYLRNEAGRLIPPAQMRMLEFIERNDGCTQAEVAEDMSVSPASVAQSIKRMETAGYVSRGARKGNLRANSLHITAVGTEAAKRCRRFFDELEERMFTGFSAEEKELTSSLLSRLIANLESGDTGAMNNMELSKFVKSEHKS
ncbi:MAG: winged helix-turn-helix transcriptional regulator [Clostridia bacterium]|nr:winged helix-turn-helix transcriptional regulator [Clostridia bacterium]MBQ2110313.1 winged helix-turn-helix transcriptional regulator [Clostridia bacterium]MBQ2191872.1 winged helix-turn-helix transcriptional regulator [Clostridia bacterium]MBQ3938506.1 winged helix-turn-helix transcriptional regulator [Clostridia bacterium]MBR4636518.1 winged helix-turn-helix transcriptional regulator [Clostridia bacterium]